ncbi:MAG: hypothetical protein DME49_04065 [Verrucomicrobia bacterium]|nr:MAG: hypothetical protein DME49_04065 [Verrucomicrobiota bacterium]PYK92517.1 MAG: hypothetical protein DME36_13095 [Verrucomicrobiota bacterium]PYL38413.1 MAG: hypothetical protein DMF34_06955 [Verrucomicrobiota bacterium]PYL56809.1 MAG: hypothetical protein DMF30_08525 [Verrucomicrobiota bacterium]
MQSRFVIGEKFGPLTEGDASVCIGAVKWLGLFLFVVLQCSCTTLANRRDLYSPEPGPDVVWQGGPPQTTTITTTTTRTEREETPLPPPSFHY